MGVKRTMGEASGKRDDATMDFEDIRASLAVGIAFVVLKALKLGVPSLGVGMADAVIPATMTLGYIFLRARREPEKLDTWGITARISWAAWAGFIGLVVTGAGVLALGSRALEGEITFRVSYLFNMVNYLPAAFPQQFFLCSVGLATLSKLKVFRGQWRLPLLVGILFGLAHFWTPVHLPDSSFPISVVATIPMGYFAAYYFLHFRTIIPLTIWHVVLYVLMVNWVQRFL
ncbi:MAG: hypothetical protein RLZZ303_126 [Candidatus Hydrogenedentota bacterium]|jgi:hypothetical protein